MATETAIFGAGCFWHVQLEFQDLLGVISTEVGYSGGTTVNPTYEEVCSKKTGHAEVVKIEYDPSVIKYIDLLNVFWDIHDPTTLNRQGPDIGTQYRSVIFYLNEEQKLLALDSVESVSLSEEHEDPIVTQILPAQEFYKAEDYHQNYMKNRGSKLSRV